MIIRKVTFKAFLLVFVVLILLVCLTFLFFTKNTTKTSSANKEVQISKTREKLLEYPKVKSYLNSTKNGRLDFDQEDRTSYVFHLYEFKNGHISTVDWFYVNKSTGEITTLNGK